MVTKLTPMSKLSNSTEMERNAIPEEELNDGLQEWSTYLSRQ